MRRNILLFGAVLSLAAVVACSAANEQATQVSDSSVSDSQSRASDSSLQPVASHERPGAQSAGEASPRGPVKEDPNGHGHDHSEVPAFMTSPAELKTLQPTLSPALFTGKQKLGYEAAKAIPETLAQLPCYCYCDKGFGHKSLHTCFVDDHAAHCAICIDEAIVAYQLEKEGKLKPEQIRERIIAQFGSH